MKRQALMGILGLCLVAPAAWLQADSGGTSGGNVLNIGVGARAVAMGESYTALADDVYSLYWNPAGLALNDRGHASFMYADWLKDLSFQNAGVAVPVGPVGVGGSLSYLSYGNIEGFDAQNNATGDVKAYSGIATVGAGMAFGPVALGINFKGIQGSLADVKANSFATDLGATYTYPQDVLTGHLRFASTLRNLGTGLKYIDQSDPLPLEFRAGAALVQMLDKRMNATLDFGKQRDSNGAIYTGLEYWVHPIVALRVGYDGFQTEGNGLRAGIGLRVRDFTFDYAYGGYSDLGPTHRYEISFRFGPTREKKTVVDVTDKEPKRIDDLAAIHFEFDKAELSPAAKTILDVNYLALRNHPDWEIMIEGFCDERGSADYNLELGRKRVEAVREYYLKLGLEPERMKSVSHGETNPLCIESNDDCWSHNRRSFTRVYLSSAPVKHAAAQSIPVRYHQGTDKPRADDEALAEELESLLKMSEDDVKKAMLTPNKTDSAEPTSMEKSQ